MKYLLLCAVLCCCCCMDADAQVGVPIGLERASIAYVSPATSSGESFTAYVLNFKVLDIEEPESIQNPWDVVEFVGSRLTLDALIYDEETGNLPLSLEDANLAPGVNCALLSSQGERTDFRGGVTYTERSKLAGYLSLGYSFN